MRERMLSELSGGWQRLALIVRVWVTDPDLLLACAVAVTGLVASFGFLLAIGTDLAVLLAQLAG